MDDNYSQYGMGDIGQVTAGVGTGAFLTLPPQSFHVDWSPNPTVTQDLDAGQRFTRPRHGYEMNPWPSITRYLDGLLPMLTDTAVQMAVAKKPWGPYLGAVNTGGSDYLQIVNGLQQTQG